jgi:dipeptidyl aminopeptidase/acylaminoacyl peptidase
MKGLGEQGFFGILGLHNRNGGSVKHLFLALLAGASVLSSAAVAQTPASPAAAAQSAMIPTADFAARSLISGPSLSPDGEWVLAVLGTPGEPSLGLIAVHNKEIRTFAVPKGYELVSYRWAGDGKVLISVGKSARWVDGSDIYVTRLVAYDIATRKSVFIGRADEGPKGDDILYVAPDGGWMLLAIQRTIYDYPSVFRVDLATAAMKEVVRQRDDVWNWYADQNGVVRAGIGYSNSKWSLVYRRADGDSFRKAGSARYDDKKASLGLLRFALDSDQGYILSNEKTGRDALYRFNFATLELGDLVYESKTNDVSDYVLNDDGSGIRAAFYTDDRDRVEWFDPTLKAVQADLDKAVPGREAWIVSRNRDSKRMLVLVTAPNDPGSFYYYFPDEGVMHRLAAINERLKGRILALSRPVAYQARDGLTIHAYLTLPPGREAKGLPLIVMPHGGPFGVRDNGDYDRYVQFLANRGYAVLQPNYRGSESYGRTFEEKGNGQWGRAMQDDLDDGMDWLVKQGVADSKRVCIVGASYGGYAALWGATRNPERYRCAASFAGISDVGRQLKYSKDFFRNAKGAREWRERVQGDAEAADISPLAQVARLKVPVLLAHGKEDQRVPIKQSELYAKALTAAGKPVEYVAYEKEGHGLSEPANVQDYLDRLEAFLRKHNPPG